MPSSLPPLPKVFLPLSSRGAAASFAFPAVYPGMCSASSQISELPGHQEPADGRIPRGVGEGHTGQERVPQGIPSHQSSRGGSGRVFTPAVRGCERAEGRDPQHTLPTSKLRACGGHTVAQKD